MKQKSLQDFKSIYFSCFHLRIPWESTLLHVIPSRERRAWNVCRRSSSSLEELGRSSPCAVSAGVGDINPRFCCDATSTESSSGRDGEPTPRDGLPAEPGELVAPMPFSKLRGDDSARSVCVLSLTATRASSEAPSILSPRSIGFADATEA